MSNLAERIVNGFKRVLPNPFTIAVLLTLLTFVLALVLTKPSDTSTSSYLWQLTTSWETGLWDSSGGGLYFAFQMMLMLVLGHCLALTKPVKLIIDQLLASCTSTARSAAIVAFSAILMGLFNWGLGLIFGAILARRIGEKFSIEKKRLNYGLVGAAAYLGLMVWHGGLSGSAPTKVMETGYLQEMMSDLSVKEGFVVPNAIPFESTVGSNMNITVSIILLVLFPFIAYFLAKKSSPGYVPKFKNSYDKTPEPETARRKGAERLDASRYIGLLIGIGFLSVGMIKALNYEGVSTFGFIQPNFINLILLGLCLTLHRSVNQFLASVQRAIGDISGILIQFPLYFGILGIMKSSGLIVVFSDFLIDHASDATLPLYTFFSAGLVNFFVPSGGGQWAIQGPIILQAAQELGANLPKTVMAMAYGDQLTNMLQPFWALPLLGITRLKAYEILPFTFLFFIIGVIIYGGVLLVF